MKKLLVSMAVVTAVTIFPLAAYAEHNPNQPPPHHDQALAAHHYPHDQAWRNHHDREWKHNEREWRERDREWRNHRHDMRWREEHARIWHDWYQWHRDNDSNSHLHLSNGNFELDIDR